jgi:hypothetical protein
MDVALCVVSSSGSHAFERVGGWKMEYILGCQLDYVN